jgi:PPOX class probable F420-dependent enzyme
MSGDGVSTEAVREAVALASDESGLAVVSTLRADLTIQSTLVNVGLIPHPAGGDDVLAFVTYGGVKLTNLRARPQVSVTFRRGWQFATVEGVAELIGPDEGEPRLDALGLRVLRREVFVAAGGTHDDWDEYDRVMEEQGRVVVLVRPTRLYPR